MALHWRPVGPEPASTYWQRRAVLATGSVLALALLTTLLTGGSDEPDRLAEAPRSSPSPSALPSGSASPEATPSASPSPTPSPTPAAAACAAGAIKIDPSADADSYKVGATPRLSLSISNTGSAPCTVDLGQAAVELLVFSGKDRIWSSDDCAPGGAKVPTTLQPGKPELQRVTWNAKRSRPGCKGDKAQAQPGTYRVHGRVGELRAEGDVFRFTD